MLVLFEDYQERQMQERRFQAAIHGINLEKEMKKQDNKKTEEKTFMFGDPKEYEKMSKEEKKDLTEKMMGKHKSEVSGMIRK